MNKPEVCQITSDDGPQMMYARIARAVLDVFDVAVRCGLLRPQDTGGVLLAGHDGMFATISDAPFITIVGQPKRFTVEKSLDTADEKFHRLYDREEGDVSAWQTRDPEAEPKQWGGAIVADYDQDRAFLLAFSGCSEHGDEALLIVAAQLCGILNDEQAGEICAISKNKLYPKLQTAVSEEMAKVT